MDHQTVADLRDAAPDFSGFGAFAEGDAAEVDIEVHIVGAGIGVCDVRNVRWKQQLVMGDHEVIPALEQCGGRAGGDVIAYIVRIDQHAIGFAREQLRAAM
ncbi:hypothetical protein D3C86_1974750 [compost metagenome]